MLYWGVGAQQLQYSLSDCGISVFPGPPWELSSVWLRPWLEAASTRHSIHGSGFLLAWQFFLLLLLFFFDCGQSRMQPSLQGPLPTTADGWKPHKNSSELSPFAYHYNPNRKYASALPRQKKRKKEGKKNPYLKVFLYKWPLLWERNVVIFVPLMCQNDGQQRDVSRAACFKSVSS